MPTEPRTGPIVYNPRDGYTDLPTELHETTDPVHTRQQIRRLAALVDDLVARQAGAGPAAADLRWAVEQRLDALERHGRTRDTIAILVLGAVVGWTAVVTAVCVLVVVVGT